MSERGEALLKLMKRQLHAAWRPDIWTERGATDRAARDARAICEHLGLTWDMVAAIRTTADHMGPIDRQARDGADAIATLLEAAGIER